MGCVVICKWTLLPSCRWLVLYNPAPQLYSTCKFININNQNVLHNLCSDRGLFGPCIDIYKTSASLWPECAAWNSEAEAHHLRGQDEGEFLGLLRKTADPQHAWCAEAGSQTWEPWVLPRHSCSPPSLSALCMSSWKEMENLNQSAHEFTSYSHLGVIQKSARHLFCLLSWGRCLLTQHASP